MNVPIPSLNEQMINRFTFNRYRLISSEVMPRTSTIRYTKTDNSMYVLNHKNKNFAIIMKQIMQYVRFELENPYYLHTVCPSARGFNSNKFFIYAVDETKINIFVYDLEENRFYLVCDEENSSCYPCATELLIVYDRGKIGKKYGDFGFILSLLDCGHVVHQYKLICKSMNIHSQIMYGGIDGLYIPWELDKGTILARIDLKAFALQGEGLVTQAFAEKKVDTAEIWFEAHHGEVLLDSFIKKLNQAELLTDYAILDIYTEMTGLTEISLCRSSSQSGVGLSFIKYELKEDDLRMLLFQAQELLGLSHIGEKLRINIISPQKHYRVLADSMTAEDKVMDFNEIIHDSKEYIDVTNATLVIFTEIHEKIQDDSECTYMHSVIQSAEFIHSLSLRLTQYGLCARPMKNIDEIYIRNRAGHNEWIVSYLLIAGKSTCYSLFNTF